jgi:NAD(P)-dependent dehydrogenase (short-subunit alcohol dehydrogenase family)
MRSVKQKVVLITGSTDGLGKHVARALSARGATVLVHGRDRDRGKRMLREMGEAGQHRDHRLYLADFSSLAEVRRLAREIEAEQDRLDVLINNAGIGVGRPGAKRELSDDGYELRFQVNYLAGFLLTRLLLSLLQRSMPARVVNVASAGQTRIDFDDPMLERSYDGWRAYGQSKLAQIMFTLELASRLDSTEIAVNALHPATLMDTKMVREASRRPKSTLEEGAEATIRLAIASEMEGITGRYFDGTHEARADPQAYDALARRRLWELSERLCASFIV